MKAVLKLGIKLERLRARKLAQCEHKHEIDLIISEATEIKFTRLLTIMKENIHINAG